MAKLTKAQDTLLWRAYLDTYEDNSGWGAPLYDGIQAATADRLVVKGLITRTMPHSGYRLGFARITEAGRAALGLPQSSAPDRGEG